MQEIDKVPIYDICKRGIEMDLVKAIDNGANVSDVDSKGKSCLHLASSMGREDLVQLLLEKGADVMARDYNGNTPLHYSGHRDVIKLLYEHGAELSSRNKQGYTALELMRRKGVASSALSTMENLLIKHASGPAEPRIPANHSATNHANIFYEFYRDLGPGYMALLLTLILLLSLYVAYIVTGYQTDFSRIPIIDGVSDQKVEL